MKSSVSYFSASVFAALLLASHAASAATFQYNGYTVANEQSIHILTPIDALGGMGQIALHGSGPNVNQTLLAWCLDVFTYLNSSGTYQIGSLTPAGSGGLNPPLTTTQINEIGSLMLNGDALIKTSPNTDVSAATQLAIWMVEYGSKFTFTGVSSAVSTLAALLITNVAPGGQWFCPSCGVATLSLNGDQTLGYGVVPLPGTIPLFASGLVGLGLLHWRRKRKAPAR